MRAALRACVKNHRLFFVRSLLVLTGLLIVLFWATGSGAQAPVPHAEPAIYGRPGEPQDCLACHQAGVGRAPRLASDHAGRGNDDCLVCHQYTGALPRLVPHEVEGRKDCRGCHEAGVGSVGPLAGDHVDYTNEQCLTCHHVAPKVPTATAALPTATPELSTETPVPSTNGPQAPASSSDCLDCHQLVSVDSRHTAIASQPKGDVAEGQALYAEQCAMCHGENGEQAVTTASGGSIVLNSVAYLGQQDDAAIIVKIAVGVPPAMPAYGPDSGGPLSWAQVRSLATFIRSWAPQAIPAPSGGDVSQGAALYADNCAACHGSEGQGGGVAVRAINSSDYLTAITDEVLDQLIREGTAGMPGFADKLSNDQIAALIAFMRSWAATSPGVVEAVQPTGQGHVASFPLVGKHAQLACSKCHGDPFTKPTSISCETCHKPPAQGHPGASSGCKTCHTPEGWSPVAFDHSKTTLALNGQHAQAACKSCHGDPFEKPASANCEACHQPPAAHPGLNSGCQQCHSPTGWKPATFDHDATGFTLTGKHVTLTCSVCHGDPFHPAVGTACVSCHQPPVSHAGMSTACEQCHSTQSFLPANFTHARVGEHMPSGEVRLGCSSCHRTGVFMQRGCTGSGCHKSNQPGDDDKDKDDDD